MQIIEFFFFFQSSSCTSVNVSGLFRDSQEKAGVLESTGTETASSVPSESYAGDACVSTERVRVWTSPLIFHCRVTFS